MFHDVNWLAVLVAGIAWFVLGALWYTVMFGKAWARLTGADPDNPGGNMALIFGLTLVFEVIASALLAGLLHISGTETAGGGLHLGALVGLGIALPVVAINNLYQRKSPALTAIDAGHMTVGLMIAGAILGAWR